MISRKGVERLCTQLGLSASEQTNELRRMAGGLVAVAVVTVVLVVIVVEV